MKNIFRFFFFWAIVTYYRLKKNGVLEFESFGSNFGKNFMKNNILFKSTWFFCFFVFSVQNTEVVFYDKMNSAFSKY